MDADRQFNMQAIGEEPWSRVGSGLSSKWASVYKDATERRRWWRWDMAGANQQYTTKLDGWNNLWFGSTSVHLNLLYYDTGDQYARYY